MHVIRAFALAIILALAIFPLAFAQTVAAAPPISTLDLLWANSGTILSIATGIVTIASIIVAGTPTPDPATPLGKVYKIVEMLALVVGKAKDGGTKVMIACLVAIGFGYMAGACTTTAVTTPAQQSVSAGVANFKPAVTSIVDRLNSGIAAAQPDLLMVCGAMSYLDTLYKLSAPLAGASAADNQGEMLAMAAVNAVCNHPPSDVGTAVATVLGAYRSIAAQIQITAPAVAAQAALTPAGA